MHALIIAGLVTAPLAATATPVEAITPGYNGQIVFSTNRDGNYELYSMRADGSQLTRLTTDPGAESYPTYAPDGSRIAFASNRDGNYNLYTMAIDGTDLAQLTADPDADVYPAYSPDGAKIAFSSMTGGFYNIYLINRDGSGLVRLTTTSAHDILPTWSPDGTRIAFSSLRSGTYQLYLMNADGSNQQRVHTSSGSDSVLSWSPDGKRLLFTSNQDGNTEVYALALADSTVQRLTTDPATDSGPRWSPDGAAIVFSTQRDGNSEIYRMASDGTGLVRLTMNAATDLAPDWQPVPNVAPIAKEDALALQTNATGIVDVLANDIDEEALDGANLTIKTNPSHGTAVVKDGEVLYTPANGYVGGDKLTYQICDSFTLDQKCATAVLWITVQAGPTPATPSLMRVGTDQVNGRQTVYYTGHRPTFSGTAVAGSTVKVEIRSDPMFLTTTADANGNWSATPNTDVPNGDHTVIITASKHGATSQALTFVLGINTGLAATGTPILPLTATAIAGIATAFVILRRRVV